MSMGWKAPYGTEQVLADIRDLLMVIAAAVTAEDRTDRDDAATALRGLLERRREEKGHGENRAA